MGPHGPSMGYLLEGQADQQWRPETFKVWRCPMGLPGLTPTAPLRVSLANEMYEESCKLFSHCVSTGILATLGNPTNSLFWKTDPCVQLTLRDFVYFADIQMCMMGGFRPKLTSTAASFRAQHWVRRTAHSHAMRQSTHCTWKRGGCNQPRNWVSQISFCTMHTA